MMKIFFTLALSILTFYSAAAQISYNEAYRFNKFMDRVNSPQGQQLRYGDIDGTAYFTKSFVPATIENATSSIKARYNMYTDTVELLQDENIFELPKSAKYSRIVFQKPTSTLLFINEASLPAGYYFELLKGKFTLLKKTKTEFREGSKAVNSFTPAISPSFVATNPIYYIKSESGYIEVPKKIKDLANLLPDQKDAITNFDKKSKIKLNVESDLIKLTQFLNSSK